MARHYGSGRREQTASCDAFVLSRRPPAPDAPLISLRKLGDSKLLITILVRRPVHGTSAGAWNIAVRTRGVFTHRDDFQKPACVEMGLVRTGTTPIISESAVTWAFLVTTLPTVGREESPSVSSRSARSVAAGDRTFRRLCRLSNRQKQVASPWAIFLVFLFSSAIQIASGLK